MASSTAELRFTVRRQPAVTVAPAGPTPRELKRLSDIDDQRGFRFQVSAIYFYRRDASMGDTDPAAVTRAAVAKALVHYYPLAGRLRELEGGKLAVDCTGEGFLFVEADADVRLEDFGDALKPPFPCLEELLFEVPGSPSILGNPLILFQVTRLACGGFILAGSITHSMADALGLGQFMTAVAELARGAPAPTVRPVWRREVLQARDPPRPRFPHREYDEVPATERITTGDMTQRSFFFGAQEVAALRTHLEPGLRKRATTVEALIGCLWKCRTAALAPDADRVMRMICIVNLRGRADGLIPRGYYGNAHALPVATAPAGELCAKPVSYSVELARAAIAQVDAEYVRSVADLMVQRGRPSFAAAGLFMVSDASKVRFGDLDVGWGRPVYGGPAKSGGIPGVSSYLIRCRNAKGEEGIAVALWLPRPSMEKFVEELRKLLQQPGMVSAL